MAVEKEVEKLVGAQEKSERKEVRKAAAYSKECGKAGGQIEM